MEIFDRRRNILWSDASGSFRACVQSAIRSQIRLSNALLSYCDFNDLNLSHAQLIGADLVHSILSYSNLSHSNLTCADLHSANL